MKNPPLPPLLYKYLGSSLSQTDSRIPFLEADYLLRFTQPTSFNDPFEALPIWNLDKIDDETIRQVFVGTPLRGVSMTAKQRDEAVKAKHAFTKVEIKNNPSRYKEMLCRIARKNAVKSTGILSLSAVWDSGLMWAHYSNNDGVCVGYKTSHAFFKDDLDNLIYKVEYLTSRPTAHVSILLNRGLADFVYENKPDFWNYEEEFRIVRPLANATKSLGDDKRGNQIHLFEVPIEAISEVNLGPCCGKELRDRVMNWHSGNKQVSIFETFLSDEDYTIHRKLIS